MRRPFTTSPPTPSSTREAVARSTRASYREMVADYNAARRPDDILRLDKIKAANGGTLPPEYDPSFFPDTISVADALSAPAYTIGTTTRKGGFVKGGLVLSTSAVGAVK